MEKQKLLQRVIDLFATMVDGDVEITADSELIEDLGITSMDVLFMISSLEEEFQFTFPEKAIQKIATVGDVAEIVAALQKT